MIHLRETHPNPQFIRKNFINLDGQWDFCFDENDKTINLKKKLLLYGQISSFT